VILARTKSHKDVVAVVMVLESIPQAATKIGGVIRIIRARSTQHVRVNVILVTLASGAK
jgi:hypothetical protein